MSAEHAILAALLLPLIGALGIALAGKAPNLREGITLVTSVLLFACVAQLLEPVLAGEGPNCCCSSCCPACRWPFASSRWA